MHSRKQLTDEERGANSVSKMAGEGRAGPWRLEEYDRRHEQQQRISSRALRRNRQEEKRHAVA
jgi:hypothetical protein